jgi:hypothetical protein
VAQYPENVKNLVEAMFDTCERTNDDAGWFRERVLEAREDLSEHFDVSDDAAIDRLCAEQRVEIARVPIPTPEGLRNSFDVAVLQYPELAGFNSLLMWDLSFARAAYRLREKTSEPAAIAAPPGDIRK